MHRSSMPCPLAVAILAFSAPAPIAGGDAPPPPVAVRAVERGPGAIAEEWSASWIWGRPKPHGAIGHFRKAFRVGPGLTRAVARMSGDDAYTFHVNGTAAREGGFWWKRADRVDVTALLRTGPNVLDAQVRNAADPGGWLLELTLSYRDGRDETVSTECDWKFSSSAGEGWLEAGFDDSRWSACIEMGGPPRAKPWGDLPYEYPGIRTEVKVVASEIPEVLVAVHHACAAKFLYWHLP